jgi:16S rRNA (cytosine1402-N4)-methyltransferase
VHEPVLVKETIEMLNVRNGGIYVDSTVGLGGHSSALLELLNEGRLIGIDRDDDALLKAADRLGNGRVVLRKGSFSKIQEILSCLQIDEVDGVLFDLGVSMLQLKDYSRGFSFLSQETLDMRMDASAQLSAWDIVNNYCEKELERILREFGEEPFARRIAKTIAIKRKTAAINTCVELADIIAGVHARRGKTHPATKTFQALRIAVNRELDELKEGLSGAMKMLRHGGRMCVISYHSLEDRIVKNFIRDAAKAGYLMALTKKPVIASAQERRINPSARSAKLRGAEKL